MPAATATSIDTARDRPRLDIPGVLLVSGAVFWWTAGIFASGAIIGGILLRRGPLVPTGTPSRAPAQVPTAQARAGTAVVDR